jgi:hypothetical protein
MLSLYWYVAKLAVRRAITSWPVALSFLVYWAVLLLAAILFGPLGFVGGFLIGFVAAACWSSYLELISQAVNGSRFRVTWDEFKRSFLLRLWDVVSVMFAFFLISLVTAPLMIGEHARQMSAILGFAFAFFFNAVPELLYQGNSRSFSLLVESGRFVMEFPLAWFAPNVAFAALALWVDGSLSLAHPAEFLIAFGNLFSSTTTIQAIFLNLPLWQKPIALLLVHFVMVFRGVLFSELSSGGGNARRRAFRAAMQRR